MSIRFVHLFITFYKIGIATQQYTVFIMKEDKLENLKMVCEDENRFYYQNI